VVDSLLLADRAVAGELRGRIAIVVEPELLDAVASHRRYEPTDAEGDDVVADVPIPSEGILLTHFIVAEDVERSRRFYSEVLGGETVKEGAPSIVQLANSWIIINVGGGPTVDKPDVILETPPDPTRASSFLNIRVADIQAVYDEWRSGGAMFITEPKDLGSEIRCYMRDPDGHLIEVGQTTTTE
jgi:catechol 2,3-dioxygenase-like lactoylglutathione lyase family enzyme